MMSRSSLSPVRHVRLIGGNLTGRYTLRRGNVVRCFACRVQSISPFVVALAAPAGRIGERVAINVDELGFIPAVIRRSLETGFTADIDVPHAGRAALASRIQSLRQHVVAEADTLTIPRLLPRDPRSVVITRQGEVRRCFIIDFSVAGAAVWAEYTPAIGESVAVGRLVGRVVRTMPEGFAIEFTTAQEGIEVEEFLAPDPQWQVLARARE
jgi:hypothetical protein